jgi:hypothetical protein
VVVVGAPEDDGTRGLVREFDRRFLPHDVLVAVDGDRSRSRLAALAPFVAPLVAPDGRATAYVCIEGACRLPTGDPAAFGAELDESGADTRARI